MHTVFSTVFSKVSAKQQQPLLDHCRIKGSTLLQEAAELGSSSPQTASPFARDMVGSVDFAMMRSRREQRTT